MGHGRHVTGTSYETAPVYIYPDHCYRIYVKGGTEINIVFIQQMNNLLNPPLSKFTIWADGVPCAPALSGWYTKTRAWLDVYVSFQAITVTLSYAGPDPNFVSDSGVLVGPFNNVPVPKGP